MQILVCKKSVVQMGGFGSWSRAQRGTYIMGDVVLADVNASRVSYTPPERHCKDWLQSEVFADAGHSIGKRSF